MRDDLNGDEANKEFQVLIRHVGFLIDAPLNSRSKSLHSYTSSLLPSAVCLASSWRFKGSGWCTQKKFGKFVIRVGAAEARHPIVEDNSLNTNCNKYVNNSSTIPGSWQCGGCRVPGASQGTVNNLTS